MFIMPHVIIGLGIMVYPVLLGLTSIVGVETPAVLTDKAKGRDSDGDRYYKLEYEYRWNDQKYSKNLSVDNAKYSKFKIGDDTRVRFLPGIFRDQTQQLQNPDKSYDGITITSLIFYLFFMLFWNGIVSVFVFILYIAPFLEWWLLRYGSVCIGTIDKKLVEHDSDGDERFVCAYSFIPGKKKPSSYPVLQDNHSRKRKHKKLIERSTTVNRILYRRLEKDDQVCVLYSPAWPSINMALELSDYELDTKK